MPQFFLKVKADLENIQQLTPAQGNLWKFDIQVPGGKRINFCSSICCKNS